MSGYTQLTQAERYQIYILKKAGHSWSGIAEMLGRHKSTIGRGLRRNQGLRGYRPQQAHNLALERRYDKAEPCIDGRVWQQVAVLIREAWSPEQVVGRLEMEQGLRISHEWIYRYIYADKRSGGDLYRYLRCQKTRRKRYGTYDRRGVILNQVSIDARPAIVDTRRRFGDWEGDTVIGKRHRGALVTLVERKSVYTVIRARRPRRSETPSHGASGRTRIGFIPSPMTMAEDLLTMKVWPVILKRGSTSRILMPPGNAA